MDAKQREDIKIACRFLLAADLDECGLGHDEIAATLRGLVAENDRLRSACNRTADWAEKMLDIYQEDGPDICDGEIKDLRSDFRAVMRWSREAVEEGPKPEAPPPP